MKLNYDKKIIIAVIITLVFSGALGANAVGVWVNPACGPTGCNTETPINVSSVGQTKAGALTVGGLHALVDLRVDENSYSNAFFYDSDRKLKDNILPLNNSLSNILKLEGVSFTWKKNGTKSVGLIAQDVEKVYPELVATNSETGLKSVEYGNLVAPLIEAVKAQQKEIESLKREVEALRSKIK